jgi:hypothetical protein
MDRKRVFALLILAIARIRPGLVLVVIERLPPFPMHPVTMPAQKAHHVRMLVAD